MSPFIRPIQPGPLQFELTKKIKVFAEPDDLNYWAEHPTRLYRGRRASKPESARSGKRQYTNEEHWLLLKRTGPTTCVGRLAIAWVGLPGHARRRDSAPYFEDLTDEDLGALLS